jgi:transcriptional regulator with XRE-family HTH domain
MTEENMYLASNIKILREEARLTIAEFAAKANVSVDTVIGWEKGTIKVYTKDLLVICPILRISEEDIRTRDIKSEREDAYKRMKSKGSRKNFDWYYGSTSKVIYYLLPIILIPLAAVIGFLVSLTMTDYYKELKRALSNRKQKNFADATPEERQAATDRDIELFEGRVDGKIIEHRRGENGFGFDPVFVPDGFDRTFAEMSSDEKKKISHRGRAVAKFLQQVFNG